jgi:hypothetical protein
MIYSIPSIHPKARRHPEKRAVEENKHGVCQEGAMPKQKRALGPTTGLEDETDGLAETTNTIFNS